MFLRQLVDLILGVFSYVPFVCFATEVRVLFATLRIVLFQQDCAFCHGLPLSCAFASNSLFDKAFAVPAWLICNFMRELWKLLMVVLHCM